MSLALVAAAGGQTITTSSSLPAGQQGQGYRVQFAASGGQLPYIGWQQTAGAFPDGLMLGSSDGVLSGTPTESGSFDFTIQVTDSGGATGAKDFTLVITPPPLQITTSSLPDGLVGTAYSAPLAAQGGRLPYTWGTTTGALPPGLNISSSSGQISGTPTTPGDFTFGVRVIDGSSDSATATLSVSVTGEPLHIVTTSLANGAVGQSYSQTLQAAGGSAPYGPWTVVSGALPPGLNLNAGTGNIFGTPSTAGSAAFTIEVADGTGATAQQALTIEVAPPTLTISSSATLPAGAVGVDYTVNLQATGGAPPYGGWTVISGSLPNGLSLNSANGVISGVPIGEGNDGFTVQVSDSVGVTATKGFQLRIRAAALQIVTDANLPNARLGILYSVRLAASGGRPPYPSWRISQGTLPEGLAIQPTSGEIRGTPVETGEFNFAVEVTDSRQATAQKQFQLIVEASDVVITTQVLPDAVVGQAYSFALTAVGGAQPYGNWRVSSGVLPPDLTLDPASGVIDGTPQAVAQAVIEFSVDDSQGGSASRTLTLRVVAPSPNIFPIVLPDAVFGVEYSVQFTAQGGSAPYGNWRIAGGQLPPGLVLDPDTGLLSGAPTSEGGFQITVAVDDSIGTTGSRSYPLAVVPDSLRITTLPQLPDAIVGGDYSVSLAAAGGTPPYTGWRLVSGAIPPGLALDGPSGVLRGAATAPGDYEFLVEVQDSAADTARRVHRLSVVTAELSIVTPTELPPAALDESYTHVFSAQGGTPPYTIWILVAGALPPGITLDPNGGSISGAPSTAGVFTFDMQVRDSGGGSVTKQLQLRVFGPAEPLTIEAPGCAQAFLAVAYSCALDGTGGRPPYSWSVASGALPAGVSLNRATGAVTGRPTASGEFEPEIRVADSEGRETSLALGITVAGATPALTLLDNPGPAMQRRVRLFSNPAYPVALNGTLELGFEPDAVNNRDDPAVQLSSGGRSVAFSIAANGTEASFPGGGVEIQTGTVAGAISLAVTQLAAGDVTLPVPDDPVALEVIAREAPRITAVTITSRSTNGFTVEIVGFSTLRQLSEARFTFRAAAGRTLANANASVPLGDASNIWFGGDGSSPFGGQFRYSQPFTTTNGADAIAGVTVVLVNEQGDSAGASANF